MTTTIIFIAIGLAGFLLSRARFVRELNARRFMPALYAAAAGYFGVRAYGAIAAETRVWPDILLGVMSLAGAIDSARASGVFRRS
jgi:hypothetical protein